MPFPDGLTTVTVTGQVAIPPLPSPQAIPDAIFECVDWLIGPTDDAVLPPFKVDAEVSVETGEFSVVLPATNDPGWTSFEYLVTLRYGNKTQRGTMTVPYDGGTVDLADRFNPDTVPTPGPAYMLLALRGAANGVASLGGDGKVPSDQLPAASSHTHVQADVTSLVTDLANRATDMELTSGLAGKADTSHGHVQSDVTGLVSDLGGKMPIAGGTGFTMANGAVVTQAGASRADLGFSGTADGAGLELYKDDHATKPGDATFVYGSGAPGVGSFKFINYDGTDYYVRAQILAGGGAKIYNSAAPSTPSDGAVLYAEGGVLKCIDSAGVISLVGGAPATFARQRKVDGDLTMPSDAGWTPVAGLSLPIAAAVGDNVELVLNCMFDVGPAASDFFEMVVLVGGAIARCGSSGTATPSTEGDPALYPSTGVRFRGSHASMSFEVEAGDLSGGNVTFGLAHKGTTGAAKIYASTAFPFRWHARNDH